MHTNHSKPEQLKYTIYWGEQFNLNVSGPL